MLNLPVHSKPVEGTGISSTFAHWDLSMFTEWLKAGRRNINQKTHICHALDMGKLWKIVNRWNLKILVFFFLTDSARINHSQTSWRACKRWSAFTNYKGSAVADHRFFGIFSMGGSLFYIRIACLRHPATSSHHPRHTSRKCYLEGGPSTLLWVLWPREACLGAMTAASQMPKARSRAHVFHSSFPNAQVPNVSRLFKIAVAWN